MQKKTYSIKAKVWLHPGEAGVWHFVSFPKDVTQEIDFYFPQKNGWGSLRVSVTMGKMNWSTSIFPDKKSASFILPIKAEVRKKEKITAGDTIKLFFEVQN